MIIGTITLLSIFVFGGGGFSFEKAYKSYIEDIVSDQSRQEQIIDMTKEADAALGQYTKEVKKVWAEDVKKTFRNYDSTREDFRGIVDKAEGSRRAMQQRVIDTRMKIAGIMTEDEWDAMYKAIKDKEAEEQAKKEKKDN